MGGTSTLDLNLRAYYQCVCVFPSFRWLTTGASHAIRTDRFGIYVLCPVRWTEFFNIQ